jgi:cytochrome P450
MTSRPKGAVSWNPLAPEVIADPHRVYQILRDESPVFWHEALEAWVLTRYEDCRQVLHRWEVFARDKRRIGKEIPDSHMQIQFQDPPEQRELRKVAISGISDLSLRSITREFADKLMSLATSYSKAGSCDMMRDLARPIALELTNRVMGMGNLDFDYHSEVFVGLSRGMDSNLDPARREEGGLAGRRLAQLMEKWYANPVADGLIARVKLEALRLQLPEPYVRNTLSAILNASYTDLYAATGAVLLTLAQDSGIRERVAQLTSDLELRRAANELIRYISPAQGITRYAVSDTEFAGQVIHVGEGVVALLASANRDPAQFERADELVLNREPNAHLGFGYGPHNCAGAELAREWVASLLWAYVRSDLRIAPGGPEVYQNTATLRCLDSAPITVQLSASSVRENRH